MNAAAEPKSATQWVDRETGKRFVLLEKSEETVVLVSVEGAELRSVERENLPGLFVPTLP